MNDQRLALLRKRVHHLHTVGWYDERDVSMVEEWIRTVSLFEIEAIVRWAIEDYRESATIKPVLTQKAIDEARAA